MGSLARPLLGLDDDASLPALLLIIRNPLYGNGAIHSTARHLLGIAPAIREPHQLMTGSSPYHHLLISGKPGLPP
jgi:hypothetical protein